MDLSEPEALQCIEKAFTAMPQLQRDAFLLHRLEGLDYAAIAARLGIGIDAVEQHIAEALITLRRSVEP